MPARIFESALLDLELHRAAVLSRLASPLAKETVLKKPGMEKVLLGNVLTTPTPPM